MPIIVQHDPNFSDVASLSLQTGQAQGQAQQFNAQRAADQSFIQQAIHASQVRNSGPGYFTTQSEGEAEEANANQRYADTQARDSYGLGIAKENADTNAYTAQTQRQAYVADQQSSLAAAGEEAQREQIRRQNANAAYQAGGPEGLAAYMAQESFAETGKPPAPGLLNVGKPAATKGPAPKVSQYQADAQGQIQSGNAMGVLGGIGETSLPPMGSPAGASGPMTQHAMEIAGALQTAIRGDGSQNNPGMDLQAVKTLRDQVATGQLAPQAKAAAMGVINRELTTKQAYRDTEIQNVHEAVTRQVLQSAIDVKAGGDQEMRRASRDQVGKMAIDLAKQHGISESEYNDWLTRQGMRQSITPQSPAPVPRNVQRQPAPLGQQAPMPAPAGQQPRHRQPPAPHRGSTANPAKRRAEADQGDQDTQTASAEPESVGGEEE